MELNERVSQYFALYSSEYPYVMDDRMNAASDVIDHVLPLCDRARLIALCVCLGVSIAPAWSKEAICEALGDCLISRI